MDTAVGFVKVYLELCGFFVLTELPVRVASRQGYRNATDLDILAVRFPTCRVSWPRPMRGLWTCFWGWTRAWQAWQRGWT